MKKLRKKAMEDALADEMNIHKKINQTKENINQIRFKLHEAEEKLGKARLILMKKDVLLNH